MDLPDAALVRQEYELTVRMMLLACDRAAGKATTHETLAEIIGEFRRLWLARNRVGGLANSVRRLEALAPGAAG